MTASTALVWAEMTQARVAGLGMPSAGEQAWGGLLGDGVDAGGWGGPFGWWVLASS
jgi:hypothetical protein